MTATPTTAAPAGQTTSGEAEPPKPKRSESLRIGNKGEGRFITLPFEAPKTQDDWNAKFGDNEEFLMKMAERGVRIRIQDEFRDEVAERLKKGESADAIRNDILNRLDELDLSVKRERATAVRKPKEVKASATEVAAFGGADALRAFLQSKGIGLVVEGQ